MAVSIAGTITSLLVGFHGCQNIMGLDIGAADYIVKPFSGGEVMARVRAILRRIERTPENGARQTRLSYDNLTVCLDNALFTLDGQPVILTKKELEEIPHPNWQIKTIWGMGYKFDGTADEI